MYKNNRVLAVVPARGGSKGVPLKNLRKICGRSLIALVGDTVKEVEELDRIIVTTDHDGIVAEAEAHGIDAPFRRPEELSGDRVGDLDVLQHALISIERIDNIEYDLIVMLQPTSPSRRPEHVRQAIHQVIDNNLDAVWSVSETDLKFHPWKQLVVGSHNKLSYFDKQGKKIVARQQLQPVYHRNGIVYVFKRSSLLENEFLLMGKTWPLVIKEYVVNIDTEDDIREAEKLLRGVISPS